MQLSIFKETYFICPQYNFLPIHSSFLAYIGMVSSYCRNLALLRKYRSFTLWAYIFQLKATNHRFFGEDEISKKIPSSV